MTNNSPRRKLAIHVAKGLFSERWLSYCKDHGIPHKIVNCYSTDIVDQLADCGGLLWHHHQGNPKDILFARALLNALEHAGIAVFPDFRTGWHFDDKVGQKYLLEALGVEEFVPSWVFYSREEAAKWAMDAGWPKVFKLRGGAGSQNVRLVRSRAEAMHLIRRAFGAGFRPYDAWGSLQERFRKYRLGKTDVANVARGVARLLVPPPYARVRSRERGYIYFQEFIPDNDSDTRVIVIGERAFALKRMVRADDFRASGSGNFHYEREQFDERCIALAFAINKKIGAQCVAFDFVFNKENCPVLLELSYGFDPKGYDDCPGYWDKDLRWYEGKFNPYGWMIDSFLSQIREHGQAH